MEKKKREKSKIVRNLYTSFFLVLFFILTSNINCEKANDTFNIEVKIPKTFKIVSPGETIHYTMEVTNLANMNRVDITLTSKILDLKNETITTKTKTVAIETKGSFIEEIKLPKDMKEGNYLLICEVHFKDTVRTSSENIVVKKKNNILTIFFLIFPLIVVLFLIFKYVMRVYEIHEIKAKVKNLIKKKNLG